VTVLDRTPPQASTWTQTRWSVIASLDRREDPTWQASWSYLVEAYRPVMVAYAQRILRRVRGNSAPPDEAEDLVQAFLLDCVEKGWLGQADARRGRFRTWVRTLLKRYTYKDLRHRGAKKRRPDPSRRTFELKEGDVVETVTPEERFEDRTFDEGWVKTAVDRSLQRLGEDHFRYQVVIADLLATDGAGSPDVSSLIQAKPHQMALLRFRARKRFREVFEEELRATVADEATFLEEWKALVPYLP